MLIPIGDALINFPDFDDKPSKRSDSNESSRRNSNELDNLRRQNVELATEIFKLKYPGHQLPPHLLPKQVFNTSQPRDYRSMQTACDNYPCTYQRDPTAEDILNYRPPETPCNTHKA